ncbi:nucleotide-diphospho-sugar transferase [Aspergillus filifer]
MHLTLASPRALRTGAIIIFLLIIGATLLQLEITGFAPLNIPNSIRPSAPSIQTPDAVNWSRFAYTQYVTNTAYLCNSVMLFETLHRLSSKAERLMMYPEGSRRLLRKARDEFGVRLVPVKVQSRDGNDPTWAESYTKLLAFNQTQYERVLSLDSDATILQPMDELFLLPLCPVAMPRAYWLNPADRTLSSQLLLIQPSFRIQPYYDMEIDNDLYRDSVLILTHRPYDLLTGEFRSKKHTAVLREAKYLHFSDWPVPKPWLHASSDVVEAEQPSCDTNSITGQEDDCRRGIFD